MFRADKKQAEKENNSRENNNLPPADSADYVAEKIIDLIMSGKAEGYSHNWMKNMGKGSEV
jgi:hypothetical protein